MRPLISGKAAWTGIFGHLGVTYIYLWRCNNVKFRTAEWPTLAKMPKQLKNSGTKRIRVPLCAWLYLLALTDLLVPMISTSFGMTNYIGHSIIIRTNGLRTA